MPGRISVVAYGRLMIGMGQTYLEKQRMRVQCPDCRFEVMVGFC